jgi:hypothetical protein
VAKNLLRIVDGKNINNRMILRALGPQAGLLDDQRRFVDVLTLGPIFIQEIEETLASATTWRGQNPEGCRIRSNC